VGTGGTISELLTVYCHIKSFRISCFKGTFKENSYFVTTIRMKIGADNRVPFGGYGKVNQDLVALSISFENNNIPLDPIYTGKMVLALWIV
jgi:1-aminocyclopropane-1-carboxylate deaminase